MKFILYILLLFQVNTFSQENKKDSLINQLNKSLSEEDKAKNYLELAKIYRTTQLDSSIIFAKKGSEIVEKLN